MSSPGPQRRRGWRIALVAGVTCGVVLAGCGEDDPAVSGPTSTLPPTSTTAAGPACGDETTEDIDPNSSRHVFPGAAEPAYTTDPPTSGPHQLGQHPTGVLAEPIPRPVQVGMLEGGAVLIQHRDPALRDQLAPLATGDVSVAPNPTLPAPVVATAWLHKLACTGPAIAQLQQFVDAHAGKGAEH